MAYCPVCFSDSMHLSQRGVIHLTINGKSRQSRQFLYNTTKETKAEILRNFEAKVEEFMSWYSQFKNIEPIRTFQLFSADYKCENNCKTNQVNRHSIIGELISQEDAVSVLKTVATKYHIKIDLLSSNLGQD